MGKTFAISDIWFNRPCEEDYGKNHIEYNKNAISKWNETVSDGDTVYVLGGFGICDIYDPVFQLNGKLVFLNNFCSSDEIEAVERLKTFGGRSVFGDSFSEKVEFSDRQVLILYDKDVVLSYFPLLDWYGKGNDSLCFHGMSGKTDINNSSICCRAHDWDFKPVDIDSVSANISKFKSMV